MPGPLSSDKQFILDMQLISDAANGNTRGAICASILEGDSLRNPVRVDIGNSFFVAVSVDALFNAVKGFVLPA